MVIRQWRALVDAIQENDEAAVEAAILGLSRSRRMFAPLVFAIGAFVMLYQGLRLLFSNWRLTLVQVLPAMWIWLAMLDLKAHAFKGNEFHVLARPRPGPARAWRSRSHGGELLPQRGVRLRDLATGQPEIRPAFTLARRHSVPSSVSGSSRASRSALSAIVVTRWGQPWFTLSLGIMVGVMMLTYVTVPARIVGIKPTGPPRQAGDQRDRRDARRDRLHTAVRARRIGILLLGSTSLSSSASSCSSSDSRSRPARPAPSRRSR